MRVVVVVVAAASTNLVSYFHQYATELVLASAIASCTCVSVV